MIVFSEPSRKSVTKGQWCLGSAEQMEGTLTWLGNLPGLACPGFLCCHPKVLNEGRTCAFCTEEDNFSLFQVEVTRLLQEQELFWFCFFQNNSFCKSGKIETNGVSSSVSLPGRVCPIFDSSGLQFRPSAFYTTVMILLLWLITWLGWPYSSPD